MPGGEPDQPKQQQVEYFQNYVPFDYNMTNFFVDQLVECPYYENYQFNNYNFDIDF